MRFTQLTTRFAALCVGAFALAACSGQSTPTNVAPSTPAVDANAPAQGAPSADPANTLVMRIKNGDVKIKLRPDLAPNHVKRVKSLANQGFYDGLKFHRVIDGFMAQTGDPKGDGTGGSSLPDLKAEFNTTPFVRGVVGMARSASPDSANSQFFIMFGSSPSLDNQYTAFGTVSQGMAFVDAIRRGSRSQNGAVANPDVIIKMRSEDQFNTATN